MREGYFLVRASVWGRPQKFSKGFAARQKKLRLRPTRGLRALDSKISCFPGAIRACAFFRASVQ